MPDLYEHALTEYYAAAAERAEWERINRTGAASPPIPLGLLVRERQALAQVRLLRSLTRLQGFQPRELPADLAWIDDRWFEFKSDAETDLTFWIQTSDPNAG